MALTACYPGGRRHLYLCATRHSPPATHHVDFPQQAASRPTIAIGELQSPRRCPVSEAVAVDTHPPKAMPAWVSDPPRLPARQRSDAMIGLRTTSALAAGRKTPARPFHPRREYLESRVLLDSAIGRWTYASRITYSFMPDGTSIGGTPSALFQAMNA